MAEKRMFSKLIVDSDDFLDMPLSTQALYFHLSMRADDEGFINNPKKIMRMIGANQNEIEILTAKRFLLTFESGVIVIKHWKLHNTIRNDRIKKTVHTEEKNKLSVKENKAYTFERLPDCNNVTKELQDVTVTASNAIEVDKDKIRIDKNKENISAYFNECWKLYPIKKGKGSISDTQKSKLYKLGDEFKRCIERYNSYIKKEKIESKFIKQGSTFFNSGYVDYLDGNYNVVAEEEDEWAI